MRPQLADDAKPPRRMNWLTASMFAKKFQIHVRRAIWTGEEGKPALKWVYYESGLWKVFLSESGQTVTRVVNGQTLGAADAVLVTADVTLSDLQATDWTALSVDCETELGPQKCPCASEEYLNLYAMSLTPEVDATKDELDFANPNITKVECRDDSTGGTGTDGTGTDGTGTDGTGTDGTGTDGTGGPGTSLGGPNGPSGGNNEYTPLSGPGGPNGGGGGGNPNGPGGGGGPGGPGGGGRPRRPRPQPVAGRSLTLGAVQTDLPGCLPLLPGGSDPENPHPVTVEGCTISLEDSVTPNQLWFVKAYFRGATVFNSVMKNGDTADVTMGDKASFKMIWGASAQVTANAWASNKPDIVADPSSFTMPEPCEPTPTPPPPSPTPPVPTPTPTPTPTLTPTPTPTPPPSPTPTPPPSSPPPPSPTPTPPAPTPTPTPTPP